MSPRRNIRLGLGALAILAVVAFVVITLAGASFAVILSLIPILMLTAMLLLERTRRQEMAARLQTSEEQLSFAMEGSNAGKEERLKFAIEASNDGVWDYQVDTGQSYYNSRWFTMLGYEPGELEGTPGFFESQLVHPDDLPRFEQAWADHMEGRTPTYEIELRVRAKTGEWIWILARGKIVSRDENNAPVRVVGTHVDISVRKRIEEQLHQSEERLKFAIEGSNDGVWDYQVNTGETYRNSRWYTMLGYEPGELEGLSWSEGNELVHPEDRPRFEQVWADHLEGRTPSHEMELRVRAKTGEWMWILSRGKVVSRDEKNAPVRVVGTHVDISERKRMEGELERARQRMADELNVGREIQMSMLPLTFPPYPRRREFEIFALLEPAREVGGDFYDFFLIDDDHFCMCVGDVSGKGVPAALFMAVTKTLIKSRASNDYSPASILTHVNNEISRSNDASMFVTIFLGILNLNSGELLYSNAGHNPPYIRRAHGELIRLDQRHGPVIGAVEDMVYGQDEAILTGGDLFFAYTDGVTEAMNEEQRLYDERRLAELLCSCDSNAAEAVVRATLEGIRSFQGSAAQADDITILATTYYGEPEGTEVRVLHLSLVNRLDEIGRIHESFSAFAEEHRIPTPIRRQINLVLDELLSNVISYAFEDDEEREIDVRIELSSDRLVVTVADDGIPFNPFSSAPPDTSLSLEERELGGLGIHVVSKVMDEVSYNRRTDRNVVILVKYLDDSSGH